MMRLKLFYIAIISTILINTISFAADGPEEVVTYTSVQDTYVQENSTATHGAESELFVKSGTKGYSRTAYLTFDISDYTNMPDEAKLSLYTTLVGTLSTRNISVYSIEDTSWDENSLTWASVPKKGELLGNIIINSTDNHTWFDVDITDYITQNKDKGKFSFMLVCEDKAATGIDVKFGSKESETTPKLTLTVSGKEKTLKITETYPKNNMKSIKTNTDITIAYENDIIENTEFNNIYLSDGEKNIDIIKSIHNNILTIKPAELEQATEYTLFIPNGAVVNSEDLLSAEYNLKFSTIEYTPNMLDCLDVDFGWSVHETGYPQLFTTDTMQFVAYYDKDLWLRVACRHLEDDVWEYSDAIVQSNWQTGSHHAIAMGIDDKGYIHVMAAMHAEPLKYFRSTNANDVSSFNKYTMTGQNENTVSYPAFFKNKDGELISFYRDGNSGNSKWIFNKYNSNTNTWSRLLQKSFFDGTVVSNGMSAYGLPTPILGPDGNFHMSFVWRDSSDANTCHDISYIYSPDLVTWFSADGTELSLPITPLTNGVVIDPVPSKQGLTNMVNFIGFDKENRAVVTYHKYDENGKSQIYNARFENGEWNIVAVSDWDYRWNFGGSGAIPCEVSAEPITVMKDGTVAQNYAHSKQGKGTYVLDDTTLKKIGAYDKVPSIWDEKLSIPESDFSAREMKVQWIGDDGVEAVDKQYYLRWEHGPVNNDVAIAKPWPDDTMLRLYTFGNAFANSPKIIYDEKPKPDYFMGEISYSNSVVTVPFYNNTQNDIDAELIVAVYKENGELLQLKSEQIKDFKIDTEIEKNITLNLDNNSDFKYIKVMLWDSFELQTPICGFGIYEF